MDIKIGIENVARELSIETEASSDEVEAQLREAMQNGLLTLTDPKGRKLIIPTAKIGYLDLGQEHTRRVGFGAVSD